METKKVNKSFLSHPPPWEGELYTYGRDGAQDREFALNPTWKEDNHMLATYSA